MKPEERVSEKLKVIMKRTQDHVNDVAGTPMALSLVVFSPNSELINYISSAKRLDVVEAWIRLIKSWSSAGLDVPAHHFDEGFYDWLKESDFYVNYNMHGFEVERGHVVIFDHLKDQKLKRSVELLDGSKEEARQAMDYIASSVEAIAVSPYPDAAMQVAMQWAFKIYKDLKP